MQEYAKIVRQTADPTPLLRARNHVRSPFSALLIARNILQLGQVAQKQQRPRCPHRKMYFEIRGADEGAFNRGHRQQARIVMPRRSLHALVNLVLFRWTSQRPV